LPGRSKSEFGIKGDIVKSVDKDFKQNICFELNIDDNELKKLFETIEQLFMSHNSYNVNYISLDAVKIHIAENEHKWYKCLRCGKISPYKIGSYCGVCFKSKEVIEVNTIELKRFDFWRLPIIETNGDVHSINTEDEFYEISCNNIKDMLLYKG